MLKSVFLLGTLFVSMQLFAQLQLPAIFTDNMVLQQQTDAPIWGTTSPNGTVKIVTSWNNQEYTTTSDAEGRWKITVQTPEAGGPYQIVVTGGESQTLKNVMIGEVWICSGQSNMEMPLAGWGKITDYEKEIAEAGYPDIRLLQVQRAASPYPLEDVTIAGGSWQECSPATIAAFSATAYFFGRDLYQNLNVPIGLIHTSWGGTPAEAWTSAQSLTMMPDFVQPVEEFSRLPRDAEAQKAIIKNKREEWDKKVLAKDFGMRNNTAVAAQSTFNDGDWQTASLPGLWEENGLPGFDGVVWYRKTIDIPTLWQGKELTLSLGAVDDSDITYFNGTEIGRTNGYNNERKYLVPANLAREGKATITVRVMDTGGEGGFHGEPRTMFVAPATDISSMQDLTGGWKYKPAVNLKDVGSYPQLEAENPHNPTSLYNAMIAPLVPYAVKGAIWYQGETNAGRAYQYRTLFPLMISDWRTQWGYDFPFYFVQLANYMKTKEEPSESTWAELREAQFQTLHLENTGMAVTIDIGEADDIHPKNKQDVGKRLALQARNHTYGQETVSSGPLYQSYRIENGKIRIFFKPENENLSIKNGTTLKGFSIAGPDQKFHWADAVIDGNEVIVNSPDVPFPMAVRYAWSDNPVCNLYNESGLPASPFRTDDWPGVTYK